MSLTKAPGALSRGVKAQGLLERVLEAWAEECARQVSALQRISLRERDRETERQRDTGIKALMEQSCFIQHVWVFILSYKIAIFSRDKIKTYKLSRKHEVIHMKERGL